MESCASGERGGNKEEEEEHTMTRGNGPQACPSKSIVEFFPTTFPEVGNPQ
jgi:hypothetical protein